MSGSARARAIAPLFHPAKWRPAVTRAAAVALAGPLLATTPAPAAHHFPQSPPGSGTVTPGPQRVPEPVRVPGARGVGPGAAGPLAAPPPGVRDRGAPAQGTGWSIATTPNAAGPQGELGDVSCVSATWCAAVGWLVNKAGGYSPLAEVWNGTRWAVTATPGSRSPQTTVLLGVSCSSREACMAVGYTGYYQALAERWDGSAWTAVPIPKPTGEAGYLSGVSCTAASACTGVGVTFVNASVHATLAEVWNGTRWAIQPTPSPGGYGALGSVTCTAAGACTAVGINANDAPPGRGPQRYPVDGHPGPRQG